MTCMEPLVRHILVLLLGGLLGSQALAGDRPASFDFYALALSWSPEHCVARRNDNQCGRGYGFVLHGLWPQRERGYPADCPGEPWDAAMGKAFPALYPSAHLYRHEWKKHGTCSGLPQRDYHALAERLKARLVIPEAYRAPAQPLRRSPAELRRDLLAANDWLKEGSIALSCGTGGRFLREIYLCLTPDGKTAQACSQEMQRREARLCAQPDFLLRAVR